MASETASHRAFPIPGWAFFLTLLAGELLFWAWLSRHGVVNGWWSDLTGGLLFLLMPLAARLGILTILYRLSRAKGMPLSEAQRLRGARWWKFFATEYWHFSKQSFFHLPFPLFFRSRADRGEPDASGDVVVLQHGYLHNGAVWHPLTRALETRGYRVFTIDQPLYASIDVMATRLAARIDAALAATGATNVTMIAHSMGGLVARAYLREFGHARIKQLVTLGSPHHGTHHAFLALGTNGAQMRPGNRWLTRLAEHVVSVPFTSIYSLYDTMIAPQDSSRMAEAINIEISGVGHVAMFDDPQVHAHVLRTLETAS
jgi:triacylglycerol lipase